MRGRVCNCRQVVQATPNRKALFGGHCRFFRGISSQITLPPAELMGRLWGEMVFCGQGWCSRFGDLLSCPRALHWTHMVSLDIPLIYGIKNQAFVACVMIPPPLTVGQNFLGVWFFILVVAGSSSYFNNNQRRLSGVVFCGQRLW